MQPDLSKMTPEMRADYPKVMEFKRRLDSGEAWRDSEIRKRYFTWYGPIRAFFEMVIFPF